MKFYTPVINQAPQKPCIKCGEIFKISTENFRLYKSGYGNVCRKCIAAQKRALYKRLSKEKKQKKNDYSTEWRKKNDFKISPEKNREYKQNYRKKLGEEEYLRRRREDKKRYREKIGDQEFLRRKREQRKRYIAKIGVEEYRRRRAEERRRRKERQKKKS